ncbi:MAG: PqqD family protein [Ruminococcus sp.]|nr:PqqD family protein [Ruminococcus sp.]
MKIKPDFILKNIAGSFVVIPLRSAAVNFNAVIKLSETGAFLWEKLSQGAQKDELVRALLSEYDVDEATASADVDKFIDKLKEADLVE